MKFYIKDKKGTNTSLGKLCRMMGSVERYGTYLPSDGEVIFIEPDDKDVIYLD